MMVHLYSINVIFFSLHKKAKQSFILSRPFLLSLFAIPLFIPVKISSSIGFHNQFEFICFVVDLWIQCWMLNKKSCWQRQIYYFSFLFYSNCLIRSTRRKDSPNKNHFVSNVKNKDSSSGYYDAVYGVIFFIFDMY